MSGILMTAEKYLRLIRKSMWDIGWDEPVLLREDLKKKHRKFSELYDNNKQRNKLELSWYKLSLCWDRLLLILIRFLKNSFL